MEIIVQRCFTAKTGQSTEVSKEFPLKSIVGYEWVDVKKTGRAIPDRYGHIYQLGSGAEAISAMAANYLFFVVRGEKSFKVATMSPRNCRPPHSP